MAKDGRIVDSTAFRYIDDACCAQTGINLAPHFYKTIMRHEYAYRSSRTGHANV